LGGGRDCDLVLSRLFRRIVVRLAERRPEEERELVRLRRRETVLVLVVTAIPYATAIVVIVSIASTFLPRTATLGGTALVGLIVGFATQRFLMDVVAGALIAFERWYAVGDFISVEPAKAAGIVEEFSFRTTVIRAFNGDRAYIPNSQVIAAIRSPRGFRRYTVELLTTDPDEGRHAIESAGRRAPVGGAPFLRPPRGSKCGSSVRTRGSFAARWTSLRPWNGSPKASLVARIKAQLSDELLLADPIVYKTDEGTLSRYERRVLVR
jgi:hypothetical protein